MVFCIFDTKFIDKTKIYKQKFEIEIVHVQHLKKNYYLRLVQKHSRSKVLKQTKMAFVCLVHTLTCYNFIPLPTKGINLWFCILPILISIVESKCTCLLRIEPKKKKT